MSEFNKLFPGVLTAYVNDTNYTLTNSDCNELTKFVAGLEAQVVALKGSLDSYVELYDKAAELVGGSGNWPSEAVDQRILTRLAEWERLTQREAEAREIIAEGIQKVDALTADLSTCQDGNVDLLAENHELKRQVFALTTELEERTKSLKAANEMVNAWSDAAIQQNAKINKITQLAGNYINDHDDTMEDGFQFAANILDVTKGGDK